MTGLPLPATGAPSQRGRHDRHGWACGAVDHWVEITEVDVPPVAPEWFGHEILRIHPTRVLSWHIDPDHPDGESRNVAE